MIQSSHVIETSTRNRCSRIAFDFFRVLSLLQYGWGFQVGRGSCRKTCLHLKDARIFVRRQKWTYRSSCHGIYFPELSGSHSLFAFRGPKIRLLVHQNIRLMVFSSICSFHRTCTKSQAPLTKKPSVKI